MSDRAAARRALGCRRPAPRGRRAAGQPARRGARLGADFAGALSPGSRRSARRSRFVAPMANAAARAVFEQALREHAPACTVHAASTGARTTPWRRAMRCWWRRARRRWRRCCEAPDGRGLPARAAHGLAGAGPEAREDRVFLAAQPARRSAAGAGVLPGAGAARRARARAARAARPPGSRRAGRGVRRDPSRAAPRCQCAARPKRCWSCWTARRASA